MIINTGGMPLYSEVYHFLHAQGLVSSWSEFARSCGRSRTYFAMLKRAGLAPSRSVWSNMLTLLEDLSRSCADANTCRWLAVAAGRVKGVLTWQR